MNVFSNELLDPESIPQIETIEYQGLHKDYLTAELIGLSILWLFISVVPLMALLFNDAEYPRWINVALLGVLILIITSSYVLTIKGFKRKLYALREKDIIYKKGLIWRSTTIIPFNRIQHAEVHQGPLERLFNLSKLKIYTAGGSASDLTISGLVPDRANRIKHYVLNKTSLDEQE